jgi:hypothetical protein
MPPVGAVKFKSPAVAEMIVPGPMIAILPVTNFAEAVIIAPLIFPVVVRFSLSKDMAPEMDVIEPAEIEMSALK